MAGPDDVVRTVNLNLGNAAEENMVVINAGHISFIRLSGAMSSESRRMEIHLASGEIVGMGFDDPEHAESVFAEVVATMNRTIPDHVRGVSLDVPQR